MGISFDEADAVLQRAGFKIVRARTDRPPRPSDDYSTYDVLAELQITPDKSADLMGAWVVPRPQRMMDYRTVARVTGRIKKKVD